MKIQAFPIFVLFISLIENLYKLDSIYFLKAGIYHSNPGMGPFSF